MTDKEHNDQIKRIKKYIKKWLKPMGLGWYKVDIFYNRMPDKDINDASATTECMWQYRKANVNFYTCVTVGLSDEELENIVIHEFVHILLNPLYQENERMSLQNEYATETIARAFEWVRQAGKEDK